VAAVLLAFTATALLAACSSSPLGTGGSNPAAAKPSSSAPATPQAAAINVCGLLPLMTVSGASGLELSSSTPDPGSAAIGMFGCSYASDGTSPAELESQLDVTVYAGGPFTIKTLKDALDAAASKDAPTVPVSGIGDEAYAGAGGIVVKFGSHLIDVSGLSFDLTGDHSESQAVAAAFIGAIGS
jgi:hypothetical protein